MIKVYKNTKIYVHCPGGLVTGGAELLHQLVSILNDNGKSAFIVYYGNKEYTIPSDYGNYNIKTATHIIDDPQNIEVIFEGRFDLIRNNSKIQKILWWLSVDNFFYCSKSFLAISDLFRFSKRMALQSTIRRFGKAILKGKTEYLINPISIKELRGIHCVNCYQSVYAQSFLYRNNFKEILPLKDFINSEH